PPAFARRSSRFGASNRDQLFFPPSFLELEPFSLGREGLNVSGVLLRFSQKSRMSRLRLVTSSKSMGFTRNEFAPSLYASFTSRISSEDVSTRMRKAESPGCCLTHVRTSNPFTRGIFKSSNRRSGNGYSSRLEYF